MNLSSLLDDIAGGAPTPAAGTACAVVLELALALATKSVARSGDDGHLAAMGSQVRALRRRVGAEGVAVERSYATAVEALGSGDREQIGATVGDALDALVALAGTAADVAELARAVADACEPAARPDAAAGSALAASAAAVAAHLAGLNLLASLDERAGQ